MPGSPPKQCHQLHTHLHNYCTTLHRAFITLVPSICRLSDEKTTFKCIIINIQKLMSDQILNTVFMRHNIFVNFTIRFLITKISSPEFMVGVATCCAVQQALALAHTGADSEHVHVRVSTFFHSKQITKVKNLYMSLL